MIEVKRDFLENAMMFFVRNNNKEMAQQCVDYLAGDSGFVDITKHASNMGVHLGVVKAKEIFKACGSLCVQRGIEPDNKSGKFSKFPKSIINQVFDDLGVSSNA